MSEILLHSEKQNSSTSVSNTFIDEYMSGANGEFVKIYLYLLRLNASPGMTFSISSIADKFEHTEKDVKRALSYWEKMHLLRLEYDDYNNIKGICLLDSASLLPVGSSSEAAKPKRSGAKSYSADDISRFKADEKFAELLFISERYLGRQLSSNDVNTLLYLYDGLNFSADLTEYLVESCVCAGHTSMRYIEKVALGWEEEGIRTVEEAKAASKVYGKAHYAVMNAFGITGRKLVPLEIEYIDKWSGKFGFTQDIIVEACRRTIAAIHQASFQYADSILDGWNTHHVKNLADITKLDSERAANRKKNQQPQTHVSAPAKNKFNNFTQRTYDYDQLEKLLLTTNAR